MNLMTKSTPTAGKIYQTGKKYRYPFPWYNFVNFESKLNVKYEQK